MKPRVRINTHVDDVHRLVAGHCDPGTVLDDPTLMALPSMFDENGVPCAIVDMSGGDGKATYDFVHARATAGLKMHFLPGTWHCCVVSAYLIEPTIAMDGDRFMISGVSPDTGQELSAAVTRENLLYLLGRDKLGRCGCWNRKENRP